MSQRESPIVKAPLYSNNLDTNLYKSSNVIKSNKKFEATPIIKPAVKTGYNPSKTEINVSIKPKTFQANEDNIKTIKIEHNINFLLTSSVQNKNNKTTLEISKNKTNLNQNNFQQKTEEIKETYITQNQKIIKEETGNFLCPNCGYGLFGDTHKVGLEKWISRESNGIKKFIFYGKDNGGVGVHDYYWYGKMEKIHHGSYTDSGSSCGIKRHIHIDSWTESVFKKNDSIEWCWKEAFTDKEWNENMGKLMCLFCDYKSDFIDFILAKKKQAKK